MLAVYFVLLTIYQAIPDGGPPTVLVSEKAHLHGTRWPLVVHGGNFVGMKRLVVSNYAKI